ncbi:hypothetical protein A0H81_14020 [Grifola frondosa]|uniref:Uncharacterized protein n=1 Tax=Grifola frondosa TaxID=5627 RepID=A0A1C7LML0_GRIFR|nr:hypothetical protein A0H81_14020 [Grifola frondosa]
MVTSSTPANRQTTADFLVAVTDLYAHITCSGFEAHAPRTALEFAEYFKRSDVVPLNCEDMATYTEAFVGKPVRAHEFKKSAKAERAKHSNKKSPVIVSIPMQARMLMDCCAGHPARATIMGTASCGSPNSSRTALWFRGPGSHLQEPGAHTV